MLHTRTARDGWILRAWDYAPTQRLLAGERPRAIVVLGHAMLVDSRTLCRPDRPTLGSVLVAAGFRVLAPDLRGHGESGPRAAEGGAWTADDIIGDVGEFVELARALEPERPVLLVGHSLFAQSSLAWLGQHPEAPVEAAVLLTSDMWNRRFEPSWMIGWLKLLISISLWVLTLVLGRLPARWLGLGTADEPRSYWSQHTAWMLKDRWTSVDGSVDYWAGLERITTPVLHMLSMGDRMLARPTSSARWSSPVRTRELVILGREDAPGDLARLRPNHMRAVTDPANKMAWHWIAGWLIRALGG